KFRPIANDSIVPGRLVYVDDLRETRIVTFGFSNRRIVCRAAGRIDGKENSSEYLTGCGFQWRNSRRIEPYRTRCGSCRDCPRICRIQFDVNPSTVCEGLLVEWKREFISQSERRREHTLTKRIRD